MVFAPAISGWFASDAETLRWSTEGLRIVSIGFPFYAWGMVLTQAFNGAGDAWTPTWINVACFWVWQMPLAYALALAWGLGPSGVYWAVTIAFSTLALVSAAIFRRGAWKSRAV